MYKRTIVLFRQSMSIWKHIHIITQIHKQAHIGKITKRES